MTEQLRSLIRDALDETAEVQRRALYHRYHDSQYARAARRLRWYDWALIAIPTAAALVLLAGYASAQEQPLARICFQQTPDALPLTHAVFVGATVPLDAPLTLIDPGPPEVYCTERIIPAGWDATIEVEACNAAGCTLSVLADGRRAPLHWYGDEDCRYDQNGSGVVDLGDIGRMLTRIGRTCGP